MCGRFTLHLSNLDELRIELGVEEILIADWAPRYNIAPTQDAPVVRARKDGRRELASLRWGLVPRWAKELAAGARAINARVESIATKPTFRDAFARRRCIVPASGFYEWEAQPGGRRKQPMLVYPADGGLMTFGGVWEEWTSTEGQVVATFSVVTTSAHGHLLDIHERMPLCLHGDDQNRWLAPGPLSTRTLAAMVEANADVAHLKAHAVGAQVNTATYDAPDCIAPTTSEPPAKRQLELF